MISGNDRSSSKSCCVVAGGRGICTEEGRKLLDRLASLLGADVATTRGGVETGFFDADQMVGLSGKRIAPEYYIAFGISGSQFHTIGLRNAKTIVAVNIDRRAPIFQTADICVIEDAYTVMRLLIERLKEFSVGNDEPGSEKRLAETIQTLSEW